jgi:hypothetical protein
MSANKKRNPKSQDGALVPVTTAVVEGIIDEDALFSRVAAITESRKQRAASYANSEITLMYWEIGRHVNTMVLDHKRATYGKRVVATLSQRLMIRYGKSFELRNLRRMLQFAEQFNDFEIVSPLAT